MRISLLILCVVLFTGSTCSEPEKIVHYNNSDLRVSFLDTSETPMREIVERPLHVIGGGWNVTALAVSPDGKHAALGLYNATDGSSKKHEGRLMVFDLISAKTKHDFRKAQMTQLADFPVAEGAMWVLGLSWLSGDELLVEMQPQTHWIESLPSNITITVDPLTGEGSDLIRWDRGAQRPVIAPDHPSHTVYAHELINGVVSIDGAAVSDLRTGVEGYGVYFNP